MRLRREAIRSLRNDDGDCDVIDERSAIKRNFFNKPPRDPSPQKTPQNGVDEFLPKKHVRASLQPLSVSHGNVSVSHGNVTVSHGNVTANEASCDDETGNELTEFAGSEENSLLRDVSKPKNPFEDCSEDSDSSRDEIEEKCDHRIKSSKNPFEESSESSLELETNEDIANNDKVLTNKSNIKASFYNENLNPFLTDEITNLDNSSHGVGENLKDKSYDDSKNPFA